MLIFKSILYRIYSGVITFLITLCLTSHIQLSLAIGALNSFFKIFSYYGFEVVWDKIIYPKYEPCVIWLTGLSGSGKTTIADSLCQALKKKGIKSIVLDGDRIRNIFEDRGFDKASRIKHNIDVGYMASLLESQGYIVIVGLMSPYEEARKKCRSIIKKFVEVYVSTPLEVCEARDVKGLYAKAREGEIKQFIGIDEPYECPLQPEITIDTTHSTLHACTGKILLYLKNNRC